MSEFTRGKNLTIGKYVVIEKDCQIGNNVVIEDFVVLKRGTIIGDNCYIQAGAKIGTPAFSIRREKGILKRTAEKGIAVLENGVDIGYNTVIQRGVERNTVIGENTFVSSLCLVAHDVQIGSSCTFAVGVTVSGFSEIGANTNISPRATILNRVKIGRNARVGIGSLVLHDIDDDTTVTGRPAVELGIFKAERKAQKKLLNLNVKTNPIASRKGMWKRRIKNLFYK